MAARLNVVTANQAGFQMLEVKLLGQFDARSDRSRADIPAVPARFLFAYLLLNREFPQSYEKLAALFWPDAGETNARASQRLALWHACRALQSHQFTNAIFGRIENAL